jgi:RsiW-degrading membrane proteinase PrsW (M82 family)
MTYPTPGDDPNSSHGRLPSGPPILNAPPGAPSAPNSAQPEQQHAYASPDRSSQQAPLAPQEPPLTPRDPYATDGRVPGPDAQNGPASAPNSGRYFPPQPVYGGPGFTQPARDAQPQYAQPAKAPYFVQPVWSQRVKPSSVMAVLALSAIAVLGLLLGGLIIYFVSQLGAMAVGLSFFGALIPLAVVLAAVAWVDRWEPEPRLALVFSFLWGAAAAASMALLVGLGVEVAAYLATGSGPGAFFSAAIQAPIVEETAKGLGILIVFYAARRHFDGPLDGMVYAAVIAAGFAFTENILYFAQALWDGGFSGLSVTFVLRAVLSPFAHVMFTTMTGLALGFAARRSTSLGALLYFLVGLVPAILLHALWNGALFFIDSLGSYIVYYLLVQVPLFAGAVTLTVLVRRHEIKLTQARLNEYAAAGWFTPAEVTMLATWSGRRRARAWAATLPGDKGKVMRQFARDATRLAYTRQRIITGRNHLVNRRTEQELLAAVTTDRAVLLGP